MADDRLVQDVFPASQQLAIVEKYEDFLNYIYPTALGFARKHSIVRDLFIEIAMDQGQLFYQAVKSAASSQLSKLYAADANLALLRFYLRFLANNKRKLISLDQHKVASIHLAETGKMLGAWIKSAREAQKKG